MDNIEEKNEEIQNRREFFKESAKKALPIIGAIVLASSPIIAKATNSDITACTDGTCRGTCSGCHDLCATGCQNTCLSSCKGSCHTACTGTCYQSCSGSCSGSSRR